MSHPTVSGGLNLTYGNGGTYGGFDRLGRVIDQKWETDNPTTKDRVRYGYDQAGSRLWRKATLASSKDEYYTYDGLNRLIAYQRGTLTGTDPDFTGINTASDVRREAWACRRPATGWTGRWTQTLRVITQERGPCNSLPGRRQPQEVLGRRSMTDEDGLMETCRCFRSEVNRELSVASRPR